MRLRWPSASTLSLGSCYAMLLVLLGVRISQQPLQPFGVAKAPFIQHGVRLRLVSQLQEQGDLSFGQALAVLDSGDYGPGMTLASWAWSAVFGPAAESVVCLSVVVMVLLSIAVGMTVRRLGATDTTAMLAGLFVVLLPAVHGAATVYQYDLPFLMLLWWTAFALLPAPEDREVSHPLSRSRSALLRGGLGGVLFAAACFVKWAALPFGLPFVVGALLVGVRANPRARLHVASAFALSTVLLLGLFVASSDNSLRATFTTQLAADADAAAGFLGLRHKVGDLVPRFGFLAIHSVSAVLSPLLAMTLLPLSVVGWFKRRVVWPFFGVLLLGNLTFVLFVAADVDERFLVPAATAVAALAAMGIAEVPVRLRRWLVASVGLCGLVVAADFHHGEPSAWNQEVRLLEPSVEHRAAARLRGFGAVSSVESLGWNRRDETPELRDELLAAVGLGLRGLPGQELLISEATYLLGVHSVWFEYEHLLRVDREEVKELDDYMKTSIACVGDPTARPASGNERLFLLLADEPMPSCIQSAEWEEFRRFGAEGIELRLLSRATVETMPTPDSAPQVPASELPGSG